MDHLKIIYIILVGVGTSNSRGHKKIQIWSKEYNAKMQFSVPNLAQNNQKGGPQVCWLSNEQGDNSVVMESVRVAGGLAGQKHFGQSAQLNSAMQAKYRRPGLLGWWAMNEELTEADQK